MRINIDARVVTANGYAVPNQHRTLVLSTSALRPRELALEDSDGMVRYEIEAEQLVRAVKAAWEIVKPLETVNG